MKSIADEAKRAAKAPQVRREQSAKRRVWDTLQRECPELADQMSDFARLGVGGVACAGDVWGRVDDQDREWVER